MRLTKIASLLLVSLLATAPQDLLAETAKTKKSSPSTKTASKVESQKAVKVAKAEKSVAKNVSKQEKITPSKTATSKKSAESKKRAESSKSVELKKGTSSKTNVSKTASTKKVEVKKKTKVSENTTQKLYGIKGATLKHVPVSTKQYTYREKGKVHHTISKEASRQYSQVGIASYYGGKFHGRKTANGEIFDKYAYTAAHKTLALGSYALVTNLRNGRKVVVRINDRGPFSHSRIIDLSKGSAQAIGMLHSGIAKVRVEAIQVDKDGYISGKGVNTLTSLAKKEGTPLKTKGDKQNLAIKADVGSKPHSQESAKAVNKPEKKAEKVAEKKSEKVEKSVEKKATVQAPKSGVVVLVKTEKEARKIAFAVKQKAHIQPQGKEFVVQISTKNIDESTKLKKQLAKLTLGSIKVISGK